MSCIPMFDVALAQNLDLLPKTDIVHAFWNSFKKQGTRVKIIFHSTLKTHFSREFMGVVGNFGIADDLILDISDIDLDDFVVINKHHILYHKSSFYTIEYIIV